jgi:hypothetical protein
MASRQTPLGKGPASGGPRLDGSRSGSSGSAGPSVPSTSQVASGITERLAPRLSAMYSAVSEFRQKIFKQTQTPDLEDLVGAAACMKATNRTEPGKDCPLACRFLAEGGDKELLCTLARDSSGRHPSPKTSAQPKGKEKAAGEQAQPDKRQQEAAMESLQRACFPEPNVRRSTPVHNTVHIRRGAWSTSPTQVYKTPGRSTPGTTSPGVLGQTPGTPESVDMLADQAPVTPSVHGTPASPDMLADSVPVTPSVHGTPASPDMLADSAALTPSVGDTPASVDLLADSAMDNSSPMSVDLRSQGHQGTPEPVQRAERRLSLSPNRREHDSDAISTILQKLSLMEDSIIALSTQAEEQGTMLKDGLCACRDPNTCPCHGRSRARGSRGCSIPASEAGPSCSEAETVQSRSTNYRSESGVSEANHMQYGQKSRYRPAAGTSGSDAKISSASESEVPVARSVRKKRLVPSPFGAKSPSAREAKRHVKEFAYDTAMFPSETSDNEPADGYRVAPVGVKFSSDLPDATDSKPENKSAGGYRFMNRMAIDLASKGVPQPSWDGDMKTWRKFKESWLDYLPMLIGSPPEILLRCFLACLTEDDRLRWNRALRRDSGLTWEKVSRVLDAENSWDATQSREDELRQIRSCQGTVSDLRRWKYLFESLVQDQDDISVRRQREIILGKIPEDWKCMVLREETKRSSRKHLVKVSGGPVTKQIIKAEAKRKNWEPVTGFFPMTNAITFECDSEEEQKRWLQFMHKRELHLGNTVHELLASVPRFTMSPEKIFEFLLVRCKGQEQEQEAAQAFGSRPQAQANLVAGSGHSPARTRPGRSDSPHRGSGKGGGKGQGKGACHNCGSLDHWLSKCPNRVQTPAQEPLPQAPKGPGSDYNGRPCINCKLAGRPHDHWHKKCEHWKKWKEQRDAATAPPAGKKD